MARFPAILLIALALAGCTSPGAPPQPDEGGVTVVSRSGPDSVRAPPRVPFGEPVELPLVGDIGASEANIAALPDGTLFVTAPIGLQMRPNAFEGAAYLWRSRDLGASWEIIRGPDPGPEGVRPLLAPVGYGLFCSCDADVITTPGGTVYYSDWWDGNFMIERSDDGGATWQSTPFTTREAVPYARVDRQWLVADDDGFVAIVYSYLQSTRAHASTDLNTDTTRGIHAVFSTDGGSSWSDPVVVIDHYVQIAHPRLMADGTLVMPYGEVQDAEWRDPASVEFAVSTDRGTTWGRHHVASAPEGFDNLWAVQADVDGTGAIHVAWSARIDDDRMATYVATSRDVGASWTAPLALRADGLNFLPWIAAQGTRVAVGWYGGDATGDPAAADAPWYAYVAESVDGGNTFAVHRVSEEPVKEGALCPRGGACDADRELLDYVSLTYGPGGNLHYAYSRVNNGVVEALVANALR